MSQEDNVLRVGDVVWILPNVWSAPPPPPGAGFDPRKYANTEGIIGLLEGGHVTDCGVVVRGFGVLLRDGKRAVFHRRHLRKKRGWGSDDSLKDEFVSEEYREAGRPRHWNCRCVVEPLER